MALFLDDGAFPIWGWEGGLGEDGAFPAGLGVSGDANDFRLEILIDGVVVWSSLSAVARRDLNIDVSEYEGTKTLTFRIVGLP